MTEVLSSDILERQFGPTEVKILLQDETTRVIATKAAGDGRILEVSWVVFASDAVASFPGPYQDMLAGKSMGKAFRAHGMEPHREVNNAFTYDLPAPFYRWFAGTHDATVVGLSILAGPNQKFFAEVLETYRPEVEWPYLIGEPTIDQERQIGLLGDFMETRSKAN